MAEANEKRRVVEVTVVRGTRINSLRYNTACGYIFYKKEQRGNVLRLECYKRKLGCSCTIAMRDGIYVQTGEHNHDTEIMEQRRAAMIRECEIIAGDPRMGRLGPKAIVAEAQSRHPKAKIVLNSAVERRIQRAREHAARRSPERPRTPETPPVQPQTLETPPLQAEYPQAHPRWQETSPMREATPIPFRTAIEHPEAIFGKRMMVVHHAEGNNSDERVGREVDLLIEEINSHVKRASARNPSPKKVLEHLYQIIATPTEGETFH